MSPAHAIRAARHGGCCSWSPTAENLTKQLEAKFGPLSPELRERIRAATEDERDLLAMRVLDAATLAEILAA